MVSVSQIGNNVALNATKLTANNSAPTFHGVTKVDMKTVETAKKGLKNFPKFLLWINEKQGEIANSLITAFGTAIIAPIFIAFNPFSKEDKDTKAYSAWRQPISAVIALAMQLGINIKFNEYLDRMASTGQFNEVNLKAQPTKGFLERIIKFTHPEYTKKQVADAVMVRTMDAFKSQVNEARKTMQNTDITDAMLIGRNDYEKAFEKVSETFKEQTKNMKMLEKKKFLDDKAIELAAKDILEKVTLNAQKKHVVQILKDNNKNSVISAINIVKYAINNENTIPDYLKSNGYTDKKLLEAVLSKLEDIKAYESAKNIRPFESVKSLGQNFAEILQNVKIKQHVKATAANAAFSLKQWKLWGGIIISLTTLPFSCGLLNWAYPRIMEKIMPEMAAKKTNKSLPPQQGKEVKA